MPEVPSARIYCYTCLEGNKTKIETVDTFKDPVLSRDWNVALQCQIPQQLEKNLDSEKISSAS